MGTRRDNRSSAPGPTATITPTTLHSKHHHEKRNHELLKRLASNDTTTSTKTSARGGGSLMSKSLTLELGKGHLETESVGKVGRIRRKVDIDKSLKSLQRQTSSSAMKMSTSLNEKEHFGDNRLSKNRDLVKTTKKRDTMTGKSLTTVGHNPDKKGGSPGVGDSLKRGAVFERLSRQDCNNKGVTRSEPGSGNRIRDRSPTKTGRKSPQEKNATSDKHPSSRKTGPGDASMKIAQTRKRDGSPVKREESGRRNIASNQGSIGRRKITRERIPVSNHDLDTEEDKDSSREKLEKDNVPESPDKDLKDLVGSDVDRDLTATASRVLLQGKESCSSHQEEEKDEGRGGEGLDVSSKVKMMEGHSTMQHSTPEETATDLTMVISQTSEISFSPKDAASKKSKTGSPQIPENLSNTQHRSAKSRDIDTVPLALSKADVLQKVRRRVHDENTKDTKDIIDDDKDVCEADKCEEDDFYKIKVHTRLVSYSNSTLVIKNTSKGDYAEDHQAKDTTTHPPDSPHSPLPPPTHTLQTSSMTQPSVPHSADVEADDAHALQTEAHPEVVVEEDTTPLTRSRSMRLRLSQFVCKGKNFFTDVYSATQSKLEQYTRVEVSPSSSLSVSMTGDGNTTLVNDSDSGYYSISTAPDMIEPTPLQDAPGTSCPQKDTCDDRVDQEHSGKISSTDGRQDTPDSGMTTLCVDDEQVKSGDRTVNENDTDALPSIPAPHVNFKLNEEWIKKNILCTCKCKQNIHKIETYNNNISDRQVTDEKLSSANTDDAITEPDCIATDAVNGSTVDNVKSDESSTDITTTIPLDDLCLCSCHDGDEDQLLQQLPVDVQELLDADHARMWWTITGNFGNILPIDWSKTYTRQQYLPVLNLNEAKEMTSATEETDRSADDDAEEEEVAQDLDLHHLILNGLSAEPVKSAEEVIREIDDLMQEGSSSEDEGVEDTSSSAENANEPVTHPLPPPLYAEKLNNMSICELNEAFMELELVIRQYSETLINQLALRDELEYEKELKNSFISLLLQVQNKRRNFNVEKKKQKKYLTTVIPYDVGHGPPQNETLQILIKILMAINEDSPTVPTLLTDYILKVLCPS